MKKIEKVTSSCSISYNWNADKGSSIRINFNTPFFEAFTNKFWIVQFFCAHGSSLYSSDFVLIDEDYEGNYAIELFIETENDKQMPLNEVVVRGWEFDINEDYGLMVDGKFLEFVNIGESTVVGMRMSTSKCNGIDLIFDQQFSIQPRGILCINFKTDICGSWSRNSWILRSRFANRCAVKMGLERLEIMNLTDNVVDLGDRFLQYVPFVARENIKNCDIPIDYHIKKRAAKNIN